MEALLCLLFFYAPPTENDGIRQRNIGIIKTVSFSLKLTVMVQRKGPPMHHRMNTNEKLRYLKG